MSSIWSNAATQAGASPFAVTGPAPAPGGGAAAKYQSILQSAGKQGKSSGQLGLSPRASSATGGASPTTSATGSSSTSDSDTSISANDFLSLLVTEMQNQDPTADTDPNAYIDQLVQINSLEQLISINQTLTAVLGTSSSSATGATGAGTSSGVTAAGASQRSAKKAPVFESSGQNSKASAASAIQSAKAPSRPRTVHGNLSAPGNAPAAQTVARALDGHSRGTPRGPAIRDIPTRALP